MSDREIMQQALEALELLSQQPIEMALDYADNAIDALRERLAQPAPPPTVLECLCKDRCLHAGMYQCRGLPSPLAAPLPEQEPVALPCCGYADASAIKWNPYNQVVQCHNCGQTYTAPPQREPLTEALAQPEQEPVSEMLLIDEATVELALEALENVTKDYVENRQRTHNRAIEKLSKVFVQKPQRKPLTKKQCLHLEVHPLMTIEQVVRIVEAAHNIKGEA